MRGGKLGKRITIRRPTYSGDSYNQQNPSYSTLHTCWAAVVPIESGQGNETEVAKQLRPSTFYRVTIRYPGADLMPTEKDQITYGERTLEITQVVNIDEGDAEVHLVAVEVREN